MKFEMYDSWGTTFTQVGSDYYLHFLHPADKLVWTCEASSFREAVKKKDKFLGCYHSEEEYADTWSDSPIGDTKVEFDLERRIRILERYITHDKEDGLEDRADACRREISTLKASKRIYETQND